MESIRTITRSEEEGGGGDLGSAVCGRKRKYGDIADETQAEICAGVFYWGAGGPVSRSIGRDRGLQNQKQDRLVCILQREISSTEVGGGRQGEAGETRSSNDG